MADEYKSLIPETAIERIFSSYPDGQKFKVEYLVDGEVVSMRTFDESGALTIETTLKNGMRHGVEYWWSDPGHLDATQPYVDGLEHGTAKQYSSKGELIGTYTMEHGTGIDLWRQNEHLPLHLAEVRYMKDGQLHGFEWWLNLDQVSVYRESHCLNGQLHGIERQWNSKGRLNRGYPRYFIHNERVNKAKYIRACATDPSLPPFRPEDNDPHRVFPPEIRPHLAHS